MKMKKGISLIVLILTIVVLLILAGVVIVALKESGIIGHAQRSTSQYNIAQEKEEINLGLNEWLIQKGIPGNTETFKSTMKKALERKAEIVGDENGPLTITMNETGNQYKVTNDGKIEENEEIAYEKNLDGIFYMYNSMYNPNQSEIVSAPEDYDYYDDENNDRISDINPNLSAYVKYGEFNIPISFFEEAIPEGNIEATITHYNGTEEDITLTKTGDKLWTTQLTGLDVYNYDGEDTVIDLEFRSYTEYHSYNYGYSESSEYHYLDLDMDTCMPFYKLTMLGKTIEFPYNCQAMIGSGDFENFILTPMYTDINNVTRIKVNFLNNESKEYTKEQIFDGETYAGSYYYTSPEIPILYLDGYFVINMEWSSFVNPITSVIIEENGVLTKYNITDSTYILEGHPGS